MALLQPECAALNSWWVYWKALAAFVALVQRLGVCRVLCWQLVESTCIGVAGAQLRLSGA